MVLFFKLFLFFFIANLLLSSVISVLANDPNVDCPAVPFVNGSGGCVNPNTTFFTSMGVNDTTVVNPDAEAFYGTQFTPPNQTGTGIVEDVQEFFEQIDFLNIGELLRFLGAVANPLFTFDVLEELFGAIGIPNEQNEASFVQFMIAFKAIFFFLGILSFIFVIFKIDLI